ncbi:hypothetical protein MMC13_008312 [Lambiella insularis]|nr:hypothetical protein [Lambiella insularis]
MTLNDAESSPREPAFVKRIRSSSVPVRAELARSRKLPRVLHISSNKNFIMARETFAHVLDLPSLHTHPSATTLLETLDSLRIKPSTFEGGAFAEDVGPNGQIGLVDGLPGYLTNIVSSQLAWIDDTLKEAIWERASERLSERAGRTAMPSVQRTFYIPVDADPSVLKIPVVLREPSLTADNLGHKTWAASYLLAKRLSLLLPLFPAIARPKSQSTQSVPLTGPDQPPTLHAATCLSSARVLELGAGTGLVGIAAAVILRTQVDLTDLPEICGNLAYNCKHNKNLISNRGGSTTTFPLDWSESMSTYSLKERTQYDLILAADPLYSPNHPAMLTKTIARFLKHESTSRVIVELPLRDAYQTEIADFRKRMERNCLSLVAHGEDIGYDDWAGGTTEVKCWWGLWEWGDLHNVKSN